MKKSNITINWKNKKGKRGLTEKTLETLLRVGAKNKKGDFIKKFDELLETYNKKISKKNIQFQEELEMVEKFVNVRI